MNLTINHKADFGNPNGTGNGKIVLRNIANAATFQAAINKGYDFHDNLSSNGIVGTNLGNIAAGFKYENTPATPPTTSNVDEKCLIVWKEASMDEPTQFTLSGVNPGSTWATLEADGLRLNQAGRGAVAAAIEDLYGFTADSVTVFEGIFLRAS